MSTIQTDLTNVFAKSTEVASDNARKSLLWVLSQTKDLTKKIQVVFTPDQGGREIVRSYNDMTARKSVTHLDNFWREHGNSPARFTVTASDGTATVRFTPNKEDESPAEVIAVDLEAIESTVIPGRADVTPAIAQDEVAPAV